MSMAPRSGPVAPAQQTTTPAAAGQQLPPTAPERDPPEHSGIAALSLQARIPTFWRDDARLWFAQFESVVASHKLGDKQHYDLVLGVLQKEDVRQVSDIVMAPPSEKRYDTLKERLISVYEQSETQQLHKLISGLELGDQRPTQLLRRMRAEARTLSTQGLVPPAYSSPAAATTEVFGA